MIPLVLCSIAAWMVIIERIVKYRKLSMGLREFHLGAMNLILQREWSGLKTLCQKNPELPTAQVIATALDRLQAKDDRLRKTWKEAAERKRTLLNAELRQYLWILGTVGSSAPFIGLAGTVIGILGSFSEMAKQGAGGFTVVAAGISEALIATAAGIVVAIVAVMAYNALQTRVSGLTLLVRIQCEECAELLALQEDDLRAG